MFWISLFVYFPIAFQVKKTLFLQADTSKETLAAGLESFEKSFSTFSKNLDSSLFKIFSELSSLNSLNSEMALSVLNSDITTLEHKEFEISQEIKRITKILSENDKCSFETNCLDCGSAEGCVWCESSSTCMKGDSDGPLSPCSKYYFKTCPNKSCSHYLTCRTCIPNASCAWCSSLSSCIPYSITEASSCPDLEFYINSAEGKNDCPVSKDSTPVKEFLPSESFELFQENLERLYEEYAGCEALIELLEQAKEDISEEYLKTTEYSLRPASFEPTIQGLAETVKIQQEEEILQEDEEQLEYAEGYAQGIIDSANQEIKENTEKTQDQVYTGGLEVREVVKTTENQLKQPLSSIDNSINEINDVLKINNK